MRTVEPRTPPQLRRAVPPTDERESDDPQEAHHRDEVLQESQHRRMADARDGETGPEQRPISLDVHGQQDHEGPEHEEVSSPRDGPLQQLALAEDLGELSPRRGAEAAVDALHPVRRRLAAHDDPKEVPHPSPREDQRDRGRTKTQDRCQRHSHSSHSSGRVPRGPTCWDPQQHSLNSSESHRIIQDPDQPPSLVHDVECHSMPDRRLGERGRPREPGTVGWPGVWQTPGPPR